MGGGKVLAAAFTSPHLTAAPAPQGQSTTIVERTIDYTYDPLNRLTAADYSTPSAGSGQAGESYAYQYDAAGNRIIITRTTPLSGTVITTHTYDAANRLTARQRSDGHAYIYDWSPRGQLLAEWTQGYPVREFTYDSAGRMIRARVFTQTTEFVYNGLGDRVAVHVDGYGATTYVLDYAAGNRILAETTPTSTVSYLYGHDCLGEQRDDELALSGAEGWLYYLPDAEGYVRQGADADGEVVSAWLFDPDGTVLEGPDGPVSHLICGGVYDWSTGLIYRGGRYFDPALGIWLALLPLMVVQAWPRRKKERRKGRQLMGMVCFGLLITGILMACQPPPTPEQLESVCIEIPKNPLVGVRINKSPEVGYGGFYDDRPQEKVYRLMLGRFEGEAALNRGAFFQGQADIPADEGGDLELVQNIKSSIVYVFADNSQQIFSGDWGRDGPDPYESKFCTAGTPQCLVYDFDSPGVDLSRFVDGQEQPVLTETGEPVLKQLTRSDQFRVFLLWKWERCPEMRVPLGVVEWSWSATVQPSENWGSGGDPFVVVSPYTDPLIGAVKGGTYDLSNSPVPIFVPFEYKEQIIPAPSS